MLAGVPCWFVWLVQVGSGYLHTLKLVSLVRVSLLVCPGWCVLVGVARVLGWKWLPACLETRVLVRALLVRVSLVGSDYLHTLNLVSLVRVLGSCVLVGVVTYMP